MHRRNPSPVQESSTQGDWQAHSFLIDVDGQTAFNLPTTVGLDADGDPLVANVRIRTVEDGGTYAASRADYEVADGLLTWISDVELASGDRLDLLFQQPGSSSAWEWLALSVDLDGQTDFDLGQTVALDATGDPLIFEVQVLTAGGDTYVASRSNYSCAGQTLSWDSVTSLHIGDRLDVLFKPA